MSCTLQASLSIPQVTRSCSECLRHWKDVRGSDYSVGPNTLTLYSSNAQDLVFGIWGATRHPQPYYNYIYTYIYIYIYMCVYIYIYIGLELPGLHG